MTKRIVNEETSRIGKNIRRLRIQHGETMKSLGKVIGCGESAIANYEAGDRQPDINKLSKIAKHYGVPVSSLLK